METKTSTTVHEIVIKTKQQEIPNKRNSKNNTRKKNNNENKEMKENKKNLCYLSIGTYQIKFLSFFFVTFMILT